MNQSVPFVKSEKYEIRKGPRSICFKLASSPSLLVDPISPVDVLECQCPQDLLWTDAA